MSSDIHDLLRNCERIGTSTWSDALDDLGVQGVVRGLTQRSGEGRFAAIAITAKQRIGRIGEFEKVELGADKMLDALGPGKVLMVDMGGGDISTFGGLAALNAKQRDAAAVIIDGGCRDLQDIRKTGLWVATRHVVPITGKSRVKLDSLNVPISIGGINVMTGDLVIGDETGIVVIPKSITEQTVKLAERKFLLDAEVEKGLKSGLNFLDAAKGAKYM